MIGRTRKLVGWRSCAGDTRIPGLFETLSAPTKNVVNGVTSYTWFDIDEFCGTQRCSELAAGPTHVRVDAGSEGEQMKTILRYLVVVGLSVMVTPFPALADSSQQSSMESIEDLYKAHEILAHVQVTGAHLLGNKLFCYQVRVIEKFKGNKSDMRLFTAIQRATVGDEYLIAADQADRPVKGCDGATNLHSSSGEIFYPIFRAGALGNGEQWVALKGVAVNKLNGSPVIDGSDLCQVNVGTAELMRACDVFGKIVRWDVVSSVLLKMKHQWGGGEG